MRIAGTAQMKQIDHTAIEERGIPSLELMERAAEYVTEAVLQLLQSKPGAKVTIVCGTGNNGGDGLACARQLMAAGVTVSTLLVGRPERQTPDSRENQRRLEEAGGSVQLWSGEPLPESDCIVDALFGVGLNREVIGERRELIERMNAAGCPIIACDIPSGINGDTGEVMGAAVKAKETITFSCAKPGLLAEPGRSFTGELKIVDIGIPADLLPEE